MFAIAKILFRKAAILRNRFRMRSWTFNDGQLDAVMAAEVELGRRQEWPGGRDKISARAEWALHNLKPPHEAPWCYRHGYRMGVQNMAILWINVDSQSGKGSLNLLTPLD